jgi:LPXTG-site transpeptidase (sortase) family protein
MSSSVTPDAPRRFRWEALALVSAGLCLFAAVAVMVMPSPSLEAEVPTARTTSTPSIATPVTSIPTPNATTTPLQAIPVASQPRRIQIPLASIDMVVAGLPDESIKNSVITPPEDPTTAYWVSQFGFGLAGEGSVDTVVIAAHSGIDGKWPFNRLSDPTLVKMGDLIIVTTDTGTLTYKVTATDNLLRAEVGGAYLKDSHPDELLLVSCFTADLDAQTQIVVAKLVRA